MQSLLSVLGRWGLDRHALVIALLCATGATGVRLALDPIWGSENPFILAFMAVLLAARYGGFAAGILTTVLLSIAAATLWLAPGPSSDLFAPTKGLVLLTFVLSGIAISAIAMELNRRKQDAERAQRRSESAEALMRAHQQQLRLALDGARVVSWSYDAERDSYLFSGEAHAIIGVGEQIPVSTAELERHLHPGDRDGRRITLAQLGHHQDHYSVQYRVRGSHGEWHWLEERGYRFADESWAGIVIDVTDRKEVEQSLESHRAFFHQLGESVPTFVLSLTPLGHVTYCNSSWQRYTGMSLREVHQHGWRVLHHPEEVRPLLERWRSCLRTGEPFEAELRYRRYDGVYQWFIGRAVPVRDDNGRISRWVATLTNIEERKRSEQEVARLNRDLRRRIEELQTLFDDSPIGIGVTYDYSCVEVRPNVALAEMLGISPDMNAALGAADAGPPSFKVCRDGVELSPDQLPLRRAATRGEYVHDERLEIERTDGGIRHLLCYAVPLFDEQSDRRGAVAFFVDITQRQATEDALREALQRLTLHVEKSPMAVIEWDCEMRVHRWSGEAERIFGWRSETVVGRTFDEFRFIHEEDHSMVRGLAAQLDGGASPHAVSHHLNYTSEGEIRECEWYNSAVLDHQGRLHTILSLVRDVTEQRRTERALRESEQRLRLALAAAHLGYWEWDCRNDTLSFSTRTCDILGIPRASILQLNEFVALVHPHDREVVLRAIAVAVAEAGDFSVEYRIPRPHGQPRWVASYGQAYYDSDGAPLRMGGIVQDVTARKEGEEALRESERKLTLAIEAAQMSIWELQLPTRELSHSPTLRELLGSEISPCHNLDELMSCVHVEDRARVCKEFEHAIEHEGGLATSYRVVTADGSERWVAQRALVLRGHHGVAERIVGVTTDVTDIERARETLRRSKAELEQTVAARTKELEQSYKRLRLSERMATVGTLSAGLGHDMGNLLLPVRVRLDALEERQLPAELRDDIGVIRKAVEYLQRLSNGLRLLSLDPEQQARGNDCVDLREWWADVEPLFKNVLPRSARLTVDMPPVLPAVRMTRPALTQAVFNVVQNAGDVLRALRQGNVEVQMRAAGSEWVELIIKDDGPGMSEEVRRRCIEPFFTTKTRGISTGLGLALVHGLVTKVHGSLDVQSVEGKGSSFILKLPAVDGRQERTGRQQRVALVTVRDPRVSSYVSTLLKTMKFEVLRAHKLDSDPRVQLLVSDDQPSVDELKQFVSDEIPRYVVALASHPPVDHILSVGRQAHPTQIRAALQAAVSQLEAPTMATATPDH